jgi:regulator of sigma E protease
MVTLFSSLIGAVIVLGVIIVIHEAGHFVVAKLFRIRVETFSVGFGPRLFGFRHGDTDYRISALPLGGYVKMSGENPGDEVTGDPREFMSKPRWQRFLVAFAGPAVNGVLAVGILAGLYMYGTAVPEFLESQARVDIVEEGSPAEAAGIQPGDLILEFDGEVEPTWQEVDTDVLLSPDRAIAAVVDRNGQRVEVTLTPIRQGPNETGYAGMFPRSRIVVEGYSSPDSPAREGGLLIGDEIVEVAGIDLLASSRSINEIIQTSDVDVLPISVLRDGQRIDLEVMPGRDANGERMIGIMYPQVPTVTIKLGFVDSLTRSIQTNAGDALLIFEILGRLVRREVSMRSIDGPIGIVNYSGQAFQAGLAPLLRFMALISLNLGVVNLLPIPILDGGVMLLLLIEGLMRQDFSLAVKERIVQVSFVFLLTLIVFVIYNDVVKLIPPTGPPPT